MVIDRSRQRVRLGHPLSSAVRIAVSLVAALLIVAAASVDRPTSASAQMSCASSVSTVASGCAGSAYQYCYQNGIQIVPNNESCPTALSYSCNGVAYASPVACDGNLACAGVTPAYAGPACSAAGSGYSATYTPGAGNPSAIYGATPVYSPSSAGATLPATSATAFTTAATQGFLVNYSPGWNIIAGPTGSVPSGAMGPMYTLGPGDTNYRVLSPGSALFSGAGAWAYFSGNTSTAIGLVNAASLTVPLPAGQFVLIGNPGDTTATVSGADAVVVYDASSGSYHQSTLLAAGEGAWAISVGGGQATLTNAPTIHGAGNSRGSQ